MLEPARREPLTLSFTNLIEAHVLRSLRTGHGIPLVSVRKALAFAERSLGIKELLVHEALRTHGGELFLDQYGKLINLSASGQLAIRKVFEAHLQRVDWDLEVPARLYPFVSDWASEPRPILIDPTISFGRPVVREAFISTQAIADRIDAGELVEDVATDYGVAREVIESAVLYERAA
ncbi:MAG: DUF433 domain-containing protein [Vicinamibacteria bacterium]|nr:DUF433 domain-containing protein [Vicinamibacteria bacterium]